MRAVSRRLSVATSMIAAAGLAISLLGASPAVAASSAPAAHAPKYRSLFQKAADAHKSVVYKAGTYIVQLRALPAATYTGGVRGFRATKPSTGRQLNARATAVKAYSKHLESTQESVASSLGIDTTYNYTLAFNGFAAKLTSAQAAGLAKDSRVAALTRNTLLKVQAATPISDHSSLNFLKISSMGGLWDTIGGPGNAGKGIVVGDLDTGIAPENPSFAGGVLGTTAGADPYLDGDTVKFVKADGNTFSSDRIEPGDGWADADYSTKIIGAQYFVDGFGRGNLGGPGDANGNRDEYLSPRDGAGHGSHTASTAAGDYGVDASVVSPSGPIDLGGMSGVAPAAKIAMYKVCWDGKNADESLDGCATSDIVAGIDQAVADGVDVLNFSIGGDSALTTDSPTDEAFKAASAAGIFVAAAGGNAGPDESTLDNAAPWETTVAASTIPTYAATVVLGDYFDEYVGSSITVNDDEATQLSGVPLVRGRDIPALGQAASKAAQCATGSLSHALAAGKVVLCERQGKIARTDTSAEVKEAGGVGEVLVNTDFDLNDTDIDPHSVPTVHVGAEALDALNAYAKTKNPVVSFLVGDDDTGLAPAAPQVADFSSRGPVLAGGSDILKPDVSAPGVDILAAVANAPGADGKWEFYSGTSMATPHVTGLAALYLGVHPLAAPMDIKSALMTTSTKTVDSSGSSSYVDPFSQGAGEVNPSRFLNPGLVYSSTLADWNAYLVGTGQVDTDDAQYAGVTGIDPSNLNGASISIGGFFVKQSVTRTVTASAPGTWTATIKVPGMTAKVVPSTLKFTAAGQSKTFKVEFTRTKAPLDEWTTGSMTWRSGSATAHSPIALYPASLAAPESAKGTGVDGSVVVPVTSGRKQDVFFGALGLAKGEITDAQGPVGAQYTDTASTGDQAVHQHAIDPATVIDEFGDEAGTEFLRFAVAPVGPVASGTNLDLYVYYFAKASDVPATPTFENLAPNEVAESVSPAASESIDYFTPTFDVFDKGGVYVTLVDVVNAAPGTKYAERVFNLRDDSADGGLSPSLYTDGGDVYLGQPGVTHKTEYSYEDLDPYSQYVGFAITESDSASLLTLLNVSTEKPRNIVAPSVTTDPDGIGPVIGATLTADPGTWDSPVSALSLDYQWLKDGDPISGATSSSYQVQDAHFGHAISVSVTAQFGTAGGTTTATSKPVTIKAVVSSATVSYASSVKVGHGIRISYAATLDADSYPDAAPSLAGPIVVKYGSHTVTAAVAADGTASIVLPKFTKKGTVTFAITYQGNDLVAPGVTSKGKFTVS